MLNKGSLFLHSKQWEVLDTNSHQMLRIFATLGNLSRWTTLVGYVCPVYIRVNLQFQHIFISISFISISMATHETA